MSVLTFPVKDVVLQLTYAKVSFLDIVLNVVNEEEDIFICV